MKGASAMQLVTPLEMMKLEEQANKLGCTYEMMMDNAGNGLADHISETAGKMQVTSLLFLCGNGNNAGDCFVAANRLAGQFSITIGLIAGIPKTRTAYTKYRMMQNVTVLTEQAKIEQAVRSATLIIDGVFGIGFRGELTPFVQSMFQIIDNDPEKYCIAVDIPSGGSGLNGSAAAGTPHCIATITFGAAKHGLFLSPLADHCGTIHFVDIGIPESAFAELGYPAYRIDEADVRKLLPMRPLQGHKGMFGRLLCVTGSRNMPGAAILSVKAALRSGVGTICVASDINVCRMLVGSTPECMMLPLPTDQDGKLSQLAGAPILEYAKSCSAVLIGCGLGQSDTLKHLIPTLISQIEAPIILDADGLNALASGIDILQKAKVPVILTPHPAEMARLLYTSVEDVQKDRMSAAKRLASRFPKTIVVLKGTGTIVATAERAYINTTGNSGMSKGGSGDVLAGMIASLTAQGIAPENAAQIGVYLHGIAGERAAEKYSRRAMLPTDLIGTLPSVFAEYE